MADISHWFGSDLTVGPSGDLAAVSGDTQTQQRILRRLLTNMGDYIWQLEYGGGLAAFIGQPANQQAISAVVQSQLAKESTVAVTPAPIITVAASPTGVVSLTIQYADAATGSTQVLSVPLGN